MKKAAKNLRNFLVACFVMLFLVATGSKYVVNAAFNKEINYQGKLTDELGVTVADGTYNIAFNLYTAETGSTPIWSSTTTVPVLSGLFSHMLGSSTDISGVDFDQTLYLGVNIGGTGAASWDGEMTPRKRLGAVPAAFEAQNAQTLAGIATTSFLRSDQADEMSATTASTLLTITQSGAGDILNLFDGGTEVFTVTDGGDIGIGTTSPSAALEISRDSQNFTALKLTRSGTSPGSLTFNVSTAGASSIIGDYTTTIKSGSATNLIFGDGSDTNMLINGNGHVGIGTTSTSLPARLTVRTTGTTDVLNLFEASGSEVFTVLENGNVGVGTTSPAYKLDIDNNGSSAVIRMGNLAGSSVAGLRMMENAGGGDTYGHSFGYNAGTNVFQILRHDNSQTGQAMMTFHRVYNKIAMGTTTMNAALSLQTYGTTDILNLYETGGSEVFTVLESGFVGIGKTTPTVALDLNTTGADMAVFSRSGTARVTLEAAGSNGSVGLKGSLGNEFVIGGNGNDFHIWDGAYMGDGINRFTILQSGNVGIGTTSPNAKLTVAGDINIDSPTSGLSFMGTRYFYASSTNDSIAIGENAGSSTVGSTFNIAIGQNAGAGFSGADYAIAIGQDAMAGGIGSISNSIAVGRNTLNTDYGGDNVAIGSNAGYSNNTGSRDVYIGTNAGYNIDDGFENTIIGYNAGGHITGSYTSDYNVALGTRALQGSGSSLNLRNNTAIGYEAGELLNSGDNNVLLGYRAGESLTSGSSNIVIGYDVEAPSNTGSNQLNIGNLIFGTGIDGTGTTLSSGNVGIGSTSPSSRLSVRGDTYLGGNLTATGTILFSALGTGGSSECLQVDSAGNITATGSACGAGSLTVGSDNQIPFSNSGGTDFDYLSTFVFDGTNMGIGSSSPNTKLTLEGAEDTALLALSDSTNNVQANVYTGTTTPNGRVSAPRGSLFIDTSSAAMYQNTDGGTSWNPFTQGTTTHMAKMTRDAAQSIPNNSYEKIAFDNIEFDTGGIADVTTNDRFDIKKDGKYFIDARVVLDQMDAGELMYAYIYKNGSVLNQDVNNLSGGTDYNWPTAVSGVFDLQAGDYIEFYIRHLEGASVNTKTQPESVPYMSVIELAPFGGTGIDQFTDSGSNTYLTSTSDNLLLGTTTNAAGAKLVVRQQNAADIVNIFDGVTEVFTILDGGNVGIGDTSPAYLFTVGSGDAFGVNASGMIATQSVSTTSLNAAGTLTDGYVLTASSTVAGGFAWEAASGGSSLTVGTDNQIPFTNSGGTDFDYLSTFVFDGTNMGIGSSSPNTKLTLEGAEDSALLALSDSTNNVQANVYTGTTTPNGRVTAPRGSLFIDTSSAAMYQNTDGGTNWNPFTQGTTTHMAKMTRDAAQSINTSTETKIAFDNIEFDTGGIADATTNDRIDIKKSGKYYLESALTTSNWLDGGEAIAVRIFVNGSAVTESLNDSSGADHYVTAYSSGVFDLQAGDYVEMYVWHNEGSTENTLTSTNGKPYLVVTELAPSGGTGIDLFTDSGSNTYLTSTSDNLLVGTTTNAAAAKFVLRQQNAADIVNIFDGATEVFTILDGGNVGIGDSTPSYLFTVGSGDAFGVNSSGMIATQSVSTTSLMAGGTLTDGYVLTASSTATGGFAWEAASGGSSLTVGTDNQIPFSNSGGTDFDYLSTFVFDGTNMGIGSSSPNTKLTLEGAEDTALLALSDSTNNVQANVYTGTTTPNGRVTAPRGSLFIDTSSAAMYQNTDGGTSWNPFTQGTTTHMAKMTRDAVQSISNSSWIKIAFDNIEFDTGGIADATTNDRFDIKKDGRYMITSQWSVPGTLDDGDAVVTSIYINGSTVTDSIGRVAGTNKSLGVTATEIFDLQAGDYIEMYVYHEDSGAIDTETSEARKPTMSVIELAPSGGTGIDQFTDSGSNTYLTTTGDNLLIGTTTNAAAAKFVLRQQNASDIVNIFDGVTEVFTILDGGNVGIGDTSPAYLFTVGSGDAFGVNSSGMIATQSVSTTSLNAAGTLTDGYVLTASSTVAGGFAWEAASGGVSDHGALTGLTDDDHSQYALLAGRSGGQIIIGGTGTTDDLTFQTTSGVGTTGADMHFLVGNNGATEALTILNSGHIGISTTTPEAILHIENTGLTGNVNGGIKQDIGLANSTLNAVQYGDRSFITIDSTATSTVVGGIIRVKDNTTLGNTIRGFEVQADKGSNTLGENTALSGFARTFGVRGYTSGEAGGAYQPAGGFFETGGDTQGNAIRGFSSSITTASLLSLYQESSAFAGTGLKMNFGNNSGSFASTTASKFVDLQNAGTSKFMVYHDGRASIIGTTTIGTGDTSQKASLHVGYGAICVDNDGSCTEGTLGRITSVSQATANSDLAEMYFSNEDLEPGELVVSDGFISIERANGENGTVLGVVSTKPGLLMGSDDTPLSPGTGYPLALAGRVPVKLSTENGHIKTGDPLMLSSIPGVAMKATEGAQIVGYALEDFDGTRAYTEGFINQFGDDIAEPNYAAAEELKSKQEKASCYYGGGGTADATSTIACDPNDVMDELATSGPTDEEIAQARYEAEQEALEALRYESAASHIAAGERVRVGTVIMFVDRGLYLATQQIDILNELTSTSTELVLGAEEGSGETLWDRLKSLAQNFVDGVLRVAGLRTSEICLEDNDGETCIDRSDLNALINNASTPRGSSSSDDQETTLDQTNETQSNNTSHTSNETDTTASSTEPTTETDTATSTGPSIAVVTPETEDTTATSTETTSGETEQDVSAETEETVSEEEQTTETEASDSETEASTDGPVEEVTVENTEPTEDSPVTQ